MVINSCQPFCIQMSELNLFTERLFLCVHAHMHTTYVHPAIFPREIAHSQETPNVMCHITLNFLNRFITPFYTNDESKWKWMK